MTHDGLMVNVAGRGKGEWSPVCKSNICLGVENEQAGAGDGRT